MIILDTVNKSLELVLAGAVTTTALDWTTSFVDATVPTTNITAFLTGASDGTSNNTSNVTIVAAPASTHQRQVKFVSVQNLDTANATVKIRYNNNGTRRLVYQVMLLPSYTLTYTDGDGWRVWNTAGALLTSPGADLVLSATLTLTNAQIKALPTTPQTLVAAPGAGFQLVPLVAILTSRSSAGAYTNIDVAANVSLFFGPGTALGLSLLTNDAAITNVAIGPTFLTDFLGAANNTTQLLPYLETENLNENGAMAPKKLLADVENQALVLTFNNLAAGNLTGGNAANTLKITVYYTVQTT